MNDYDKEFLNVINEYYPFERYIMQNPEPIIGDAVLLELFVASTKIEPIMSGGKFLTYTSVQPEDVYVKIKGPAGVITFGYFDFAEHVRENIRDVVYEDFGAEAWERLYVDNEYASSLKNVLENQEKLITKIYGECKVKSNFTIELQCIEKIEL